MWDGVFCGGSLTAHNCHDLDRSNTVNIIDETNKKSMHLDALFFSS